MSKLVVVESPAKARTISKFLGDGYEVFASMGHVLDLPSKKMGIDIENDFTPTYVIIPKKKKIVTQLKKLAKKKEKIFLASDPDREGEAIAGHIATQLEKICKDVLRVEFYEITKPAIEKAIRDAHHLDQNKIHAQQARRILDRVVGYSLSPLLWKKVSRGLSAGRVQSVALRIIVERENEIKGFVSREYWSIEAELKKKNAELKDIFSARLEKIDGAKIEIADEKSCTDLTEQIKNEPFIVTDVKESAKKRNPAAPLTTSKMQQEAYNRFHFSVHKTMVLAQQLYEGLEIGEEGPVGLITYMRTDAVHVSESALTSVRKYIGEEYGKEYLPPKPNVYKSKKHAQAAHEAIRPTSVHRTPDEVKTYLTEEQFKLYSLIWKKFVASQMKPAVFSVTAVEISAGRFLFKATGSQLVFSGWLRVLPSGNESDNILPNLKIKDELDLIRLLPEQHFTQPPARFTDATLVKILEEEGIGRPSTYAPIIQTIVLRHYVNREKGQLIPTELGTVVINLLIEYFPKILDTKFTAQMEEHLDTVEEGTLNWVKLLNDFYPSFIKRLKIAQGNMREVKKEIIPTNEVCEKCGKPIVIKWGRHGKFLSCSDFPACRFAKAISLGVKCPQTECGGELVRRRSKRGRYFYGCSNYPNCRYITNKLPEE
ncbi:MAG: type I DNA topoisomerase [Candidatus Omnitrophota bacterium]